MNPYGLVFQLTPVDPKIANKCNDPPRTYSNEEILNKNRILFSSFADRSLIMELFKAKLYLHNNLIAYKKFRNTIIPTTHIFEGRYYQYHTYIKPSLPHRLMKNPYSAVLIHATAVKESFR